MTRTQETHAPTRAEVAIVAPPRTVASTVTGPADIFSLSGVLWPMIHGRLSAPAFRVRIASLDGSPVSCLNGTRILPDCAVAEIESANLVVLSAADIATVPEAATVFTPWLRKFHLQRRRVMSSATQGEFVIREAKQEEYEALGQLMVSVYSSLEGFPQQDEQPRYYEMLAHIGRMASKPDTKLVVAVSGSTLLGGVVYYADMAQYGSGGTATREKNASGFRLLAVSPTARGRGVGQALIQACIALARERKHPQLIIHTTRAMQVAWGMYERMGFRRSEDLDFMQENLQVFGFRLDL